MLQKLPILRSVNAIQERWEERAGQGVQSSARPVLIEFIFRRRYCKILLSTLKLSICLSASIYNSFELPVPTAQVESSSLSFT